MIDGSFASRWMDDLISDSTTDCNSFCIPQLTQEGALNRPTIAFLLLFILENSRFIGFPLLYNIIYII